MKCTSKLAYIYESNGIILTKEQMYEGERILYKNENIKYEDDKKNIERGTNVYFTNFRVICLSTKFAFDIPLMFISGHYVKRPFIQGSPYINIDLPKGGVSLLSKCPKYILENYSQNELRNANLKYPNYAMIKFKDKHADLEGSNNILELAINSKEYNLSFKKPEAPKPILPAYNSSIQPGQSQFGNEEEKPVFSSQIGGSGLGMARIQNLMKQKMAQQNQMIQGSFSDIQSLRQNAKEMIELAQQIRAKINLAQQQQQQGGSTQQSQSELNSVLSKIGFIDPVTKEVAGSEYYLRLAEQINDYFNDYFIKNPSVKVITLIDAYCIYNRARGGNTVSPKDMQQALKNFKSVSNKIMIKNFNNEMIVLHTKDFSNQNILNLVMQFMKQKNEEFVTVNELTKILNVKNVILEKILIEDMLNGGYLLIDEYDLDVRYYLNKIREYKI